MDWLEEVKKRPEGVSVYDKIKSHNLPVVIYGAAKAAKQLLGDLKAHQIFPEFCVVDDKFFSEGKTFEGLEVKKVSSLKGKQYVVTVGFGLGYRGIWQAKCADLQMPCYIVICDYVEEISLQYLEQHAEEFDATYQMLEDDLSRRTWVQYLKAHIYKEPFNQAFADLCVNEETNRQYFPDFVKKLPLRGLFVDCGAYIGDTIEDYVKLAAPVPGGGVYWPLNLIKTPL